MPPKHEGGKEEMGVKKHESGERNGRVRKRLFMRGETRQRVGGSLRGRAKDKSRREKK